LVEVPLMNNFRHFELEIAELKRALVGMGNVVEQSLSASVDAILNPRVEAREEARLLEERLDAMDTAIEERAHRIMALQHPMISDLRLLISALHICSDLEQVGDLCESIAKRATWIAKHTPIENPPDLLELGRLVKDMIHGCLDAFVSSNTEMAKTVITQEDRSDDLTKLCYESIQTSMAKTPDKIREYTHLLRAVAHLEHIGDIAVAIAEESVYVHKGQMIRHHHEDLR